MDAVRGEARVTGSATISVDPDACVASSTCVLIAPQIFVLESGAGVATVELAVVDDAELIALAREAEESCPSEAILVELQEPESKE